MTLAATFARAGVSFGSQDMAFSWAAAQAALEVSIPSVVPWLLLCALAGPTWPVLRRHPRELLGWGVLVVGLEALAIAHGADGQRPGAMILWVVTAAVTLLALLGWAALGLVAAGRFRRSALWTFAVLAAASGLASRVVFVSGGILNTLGLSGLPGLWLLRPALDIAEFVSLAGVLWIAGRRHTARDPADPANGG